MHGTSYGGEPGWTGVGLGGEFLHEGEIGWPVGEGLGVDCNDGSVESVALFFCLGGFCASAASSVSAGL